ncbi:MAG: EF-hand domain-containing protein [Verrucomicrobia bacterium]|nr:EF-hand domain-containing protein [Verrucomicrobiota bacterium]
MKPIIKALAAIILCAAVAGAAEKGKKRTSEKTTTEDPAKKDFRQCDTNRDGFVSLAEWKAASKNDGTKSETLFKAKDKNNDGKLSRDEFMAEAPAGTEVRKYTRQVADQQLRRLKRLLEDGLIKKDMYDRKIAEIESNIDDKPATPAKK